jgi:uncharacterized membrane protein
MRSRLLQLWENLRSSFWFVPSLMAFAAIALSFATVGIDAGPLGQSLANSAGWLWSGGAEGARSLLSTVASSMITVTGTVFSITIAALTLASSQFGPRLLRNFTRDTGNRVVLGTFVGTFLYCLLVLRTIRGESEGGFVPYLSVTCGVLLATASVGVLIYFIHHIASSIQAETVTAVVGAELKSDIARLSPPAPPGPGDSEVRCPVLLPNEPACRVQALGSGYVQHLDRDGLFDTAEERNLVIQLLCRPGDFVSHGEALLQAWTQGGNLSENDAHRLRRCFSLGPQRTSTQDMRYGVRQLTEIAARALSPGINDPFTAMNCADWLADALAELARRGVPSGVRHGADDALRLVEQPIGFAEIARLSFEPFRIYGAGSAVVVSHMLHLFAGLARQLESREFRLDLMREAEEISATARLTSRSEADARTLQSALDQVRVSVTAALPT